MTTTVPKNKPDSAPRQRRVSESRRRKETPEAKEETPPDTSVGFSLIVPAYNEEGGIASSLDHVLEILDKSDLEHEIIVVDDGSTDRTVESLAAYGGRIRVLQHHANKGYGAALKTGIRNARFATIVITDADGTYPNERIPELVKHKNAGGFHMVVGARTGRNVAIPLIRKPAKWAIGKLANFVVGEKIPDINSGLRIFDRDVALKFFPMFPDGFSFTTTITMCTLSNGYLVEFVPIDYHARVGRSKIRPIRDTLNFVQLIARMALYFAPLKLFLPLSLILFLAGIGWGVSTKLLTEELADISTLIIMMAALHIGAIGLLAELMHTSLAQTYRRDE